MEKLTKAAAQRSQQRVTTVATWLYQAAAGATLYVKESGEGPLYGLQNDPKPLTTH